MLYELLSPSIELEIDRALDCSPMSVSTANPILRRLGVAGGGSDRHFSVSFAYTHAAAVGKTALDAAPEFAGLR